MREETSTIDASLLVAQSGWVRSLARHLVRDPEGAEDVAQETLLAALASPPRDVADAKRLRAWLGRVAFNLAHLARRRNSRRLAREERSARSEHEDSTADAFVNDSLDGLVVEAVRTLEEPYRTTVHLRYFEGLSTTEVALRTETTNSAVRKRLWRARGKLRRQLDSKHNGERHAWFRVLAPLAGLRLEEVGSPPSAPAAATTLGVGWKAAAVLPLFALGLWSAGDLLSPTRPALSELAHAQTSPPSGGGIDAGHGLVPSPSDQAGGPRPQDPGSGERDGPRVRTRRIALDSGPPQDGPGSGATVSGFVVDLWGNPLGGVDLVEVREPERVLGRTGANGGFELAAPSLPATLEVRSTGYTSLHAARIEAETAGWSSWLVAAPAVSLAGRVVDEFGRALEGATLEVLLDEAAFVDLPVLVDVRSTRPPRVTTGADGQFVLDRVPTGAGIALRAEHPGYESRTWAVPPLSDAGLRIELASRTDLGTLAGVVLDEEQRPLAGVELALAGFTAWTDERGAFSMPVPPGADTTAALTAKKAGYEQTCLACEREDEVSTRVRLVMQTATRSVLGQVVDEQGKPLAGWLVFAAPPMTSLAESPAEGGGEAGADDAQDLARLAGARSGEDGSFRLGGLVEGPYALLGVDPETLLLTEACVARTDGPEVQLLARTAALPAALPGRVLSRDGMPLPDALVRAELCLATEHGTFLAASTGVRTDARGRFELARVAAEHVRLRVEHPLVHGRRAVTRISRTSGEPAELRVDLTLPMRFSGAADAVEVLDATGRPLVLEGFTRPRSRVRLVAGRSPIQGVSQAACTVVWYRDGVVVGREPLPLLGRGLGASDVPLSLHR